MAQELTVINSDGEIVSSHLQSNEPANNLVVQTQQQFENVYQNAGMLVLSEYEKSVLSQTIPDHWVEIKPDGSVYLPQVFMRKILNQAFGEGAWVLRRQNLSTQQVTDNQIIVFYDGILLVRGCYVAQAIGEQRYFTNNRNSSYATAAEGAKSDCLTRCCKDLGIASQLWQPKYVRDFKTKYCIQNGNNWQLKDDKIFDFKASQLTILKIYGELVEREVPISEMRPDFVNKVLATQDRNELLVLYKEISVIKENAAKEA